MQIPPREVYDAVLETRDVVRSLVATVKAQGRELAALKPRVTRLERAALVVAGAALATGTGLGAALSGLGGG